MHDKRRSAGERVDEDVALATFDLLARVVAVAAPLFRRLHRLAIDDAGARIALPPHRLAQVAVELIVDAFPGTVLLPRREVVVERLPLGQVMRTSRHAQPLRRTYRTPFRISRRSYFTGRPPGLGGGIRSLMTAYSSSFRSVG